MINSVLTIHGRILDNLRNTWMSKTIGRALIDLAQASGGISEDSIPAEHGNHLSTILHIPFAPLIYPQRAYS